MKSNLDEADYGEPESAITKEMVEVAMSGTMTVEEVINDHKQAAKHGHTVH